MKRMKKSLFLTMLAFVAVLCLAIAACGGGGIKFKFNTGKGAPKVDDIQLEEGEECKLPTPPEWEGHIFDGWYLTEDLSGSPVEVETATESKTFYAKWSTAYKLTLDLDGGTLSTTTLSLREGANLSEALKDLVPEKNGFEFGEWLNGSAPLSASAKMPAEDLTLKAHYKVGYTVQIFEQDLEGDTYTKLEEDYHGFEYATGTAFTPEYAPAGFTAADNPNAVTSKVLSETDPSQNVFTLYYDRNTITVFFCEDEDSDPDPDRDLSGRYGEKIDLRADYTREGYLLIGWTDSVTAETVYPIAHDIENGTETAEQYTLPADNVTLYAVWEEARTDIFGGADSIYVSGDKAYLQRGPFLFLGTQRATNRYVFRVTAGDADTRSMLECRVFDDGKFCYSDSARGALTAVRGDYSTGTVDTSTTILFDEYNEIEYVVENEDQTSRSSKGTVFVNDDGLYETEFTSGEMVGKDFAFVLATLTDGSYAFIVRDELAALGPIPLCYFDAEENALYSFAEMMGYAGYSMQIEFDGFNNATLYLDGRAAMKLVYRIYQFEGTDEEAIITYTSDGEFFASFMIMSAQSQDLAVYFDIEYYGEYYDGESEDEDSDVLFLDGMGYASYYTAASGDAVWEGIYELSYSMLGFDLVTVTVDGTDGPQIYIFELVFSQGYGYFFALDTYNEYYYSYDEEYGSPILIEGYDGAGTFMLFAATADGENFPLIAAGTLEKNGNEYTATVVADPGIDLSKYEFDLDFDPAKLTSFTFIARAYGSGNLMFWTSYTVDGTKTDLKGTEYKNKETPEDGSSLIVINGYGTYTDAEETMKKGLLIKSDIYAALFCDDKDGTILYFALDEEGKTFTRLNEKEIYYYDELRNGDFDSTHYLEFDGQGNVYYTEETEGENGNTVTTRIKGKVAKTEDVWLEGKTPEENEMVWQFTNADGETSLTFRFVLVDYKNQTGDGITTYFLREDTLADEYTNEQEDILVLDGFMFGGYVHGSSLVEGIYYLPYEDEPDIIVLMDMDSDDTYIFRIKKDGKTFALLDEAWSDSFIINNSTGLSEDVLHFDGEGHVEVRRYAEEEDADPAYTKVGTGTYTYDNTTGLYTVTYSYTEEPSKAITLIGNFDSAYVGSTPVSIFYVFYEEVYNIYLNTTDWTVLVLDGFGTAIRLLQNGAPEYGYYYILDENLIYYVNEDSTDAGIFTLAEDGEFGRLTAVTLKETGYFTQDLEPLIFTDYGVVIYQDEGLCYYSVANGEYSLYYEAALMQPEEIKEGETINKYGFIKRSISLGATVTFGENTYYKNEGAEIEFTRTGSNFPISDIVKAANGTSIGTLTFRPRSAKEYEVDATVIYTPSDDTETEIPCTVSRVERTVGEETVSYYYVNIYFSSDGQTVEGALQFTVQFTYNTSGKGTYKVTEMRVSDRLYSMEDMLLALQGMIGSEDEMSYIDLWTEYDEHGAEKTDGEHASAVFSSTMGLYDYSGAAITGFDVGEVELLSSASEYGTQFYMVKFKAGEDNYYFYFMREPYYEYYLGPTFIPILATREQIVTVETEKSPVITLEVVVANFEIAYEEYGIYYDIGEYYYVDFTAADFAVWWTLDNETFYFLEENAYDTTATIYAVTLTAGMAPSANVPPRFTGATMDDDPIEAKMYEDAVDRITVIASGTGAQFRVWCFYDESDPTDPSYICADRTTQNDDGSYTVMVSGYTFRVTINDNGTADVDVPDFGSSGSSSYSGYDDYYGYLA